MEEASPTGPGVGAFVARARQKVGVSQRELSARIRRSPAYVSKLEADAITPSFDALSEVAVALDLTPLEVWFLCRIALLRRGNRMVVTPCWESDFDGYKQRTQAVTDAFSSE